MNSIINNKKSIAAAAAAAVILTVYRLFLLENATDYPSGLVSVTGTAAANIFWICAAVFAIVIALLTVSDCKKMKYGTLDELSSRGCTCIGFCLVINGAALAIPLISSLSKGVDLAVLGYLAGCAAGVAGGMFTAVKGRISPVLGLAGIFLSASRILSAVVYFLSNPLISHIPQKLIMLTLVVLSAVYWLAVARIFVRSGSVLGRKITLASGFCLGALTLTAALSGYLFVLIDNEKWLMLADIPDIEMIISGLVPAAVSAILLCAGKSGRGAAKPAAPAEDKAAAADGMQNEDMPADAYGEDADGEEA